MSNLPQLDMYVGEARTFNMNFAKKIGSDDLTGSPTFAISAGGPAIANTSVSGKKAQAKFTATSVEPKTYTVTCSVADDASVAQTVRGVARLRVKSFP